MTALFTQNRQAVWNYDSSVSYLHITKSGNSINVVTKNGAGGEAAKYRTREQCIFVMEMLMAALEADDRTFAFPEEAELEQRMLHKRHSSSGGGNRHGGS